MHDVTRLKSSLKLFRSPNFIALIICLIAFCVWGEVLITKYANFGYGDWDLAFFSQAMWNLSHGNPYVTLFDTNFFGNHANFIALFILPLFYLFPHPFTLIVTKLLFFVGSAFLLFRIAQKQIRSWPALVVMGLYLIYPPNVFAMLYEFDFEALAPFFIFLLFLTYQEKWFLGFIATAVALILIKENMPLIVIMFGIHALITRKGERVRWGGVPLIMGAAAFYFITAKVIPALSSAPKNIYLSSYSHLGNSLSGVILTLLSNPLKAIQDILTPVNLNYLSQLFLPVFFTAFLSPQILLLSAPIFMQHLLSSVPQQHTIFYNYVFTLAPFIFLAAVNSLKLILNHSRRAFFYFFILGMIISSFYEVNNYKYLFAQRLDIKKDNLNPYRWQFADLIAREDSTVASFEFLAPLSPRKNLYSFHKVYWDPFVGHFHAPAHISAALVDFQERWLQDSFGYAASQPEVVKRIQDFFQDWGAVASAENIVLLKKGEGTKLVAVTNEGPEPKAYPVLTVGNDFSLVSFESAAAKAQPNDLIPMTFVWQSHADIQKNYMVVFFLRDNNALFRRCIHTIGYMLYPTIVWKEGDLVMERFNLFVPLLKPGEYTIEVGFIDANTKELVAISSARPLALNKKIHQLTKLVIL